ncbi:hypothetical protein [Pseudoxanthomonas wuyuanensis]|uniref:hypothetical protein n=1 Tax=Pseudoxanthomonas wuyuanensis TaxID=1073196 RepID=UPI000BE39F8D|nr:hypothetical protein [Pseudoxanthomonas wuyuanensis]KAF1716597.1 hypothetical protein CSC75_19365 [Pseudoxanthomonas wuyuanensis]
MTTDEVFDSHEVTGYLVVNASGAKLRRELTLEDARAWMEELIREESLQPVARPPRPRRMGP